MLSLDSLFLYVPENIVEEMQLECCEEILFHTCTLLYVQYLTYTPYLMQHFTYQSRLLNSWVLQRLHPTRSPIKPVSIYKAAPSINRKLTPASV